MYQFLFTKQKVPYRSEVHGSLQNCGPSVCNWFSVILLALRMRRVLLDFWKICVPLI